MLELIDIDLSSITRYCSSLPYVAPGVMKLILLYGEYGFGLAELFTLSLMIGESYIFLFYSDV